MAIVSGLGEALKLLRNRRGWPQKQLSAAARVTKAMVSSYEKGKQMPTLATLDRILTALGADLCDLFCVIELVHGRSGAIHGLSPQFQPGQARSARPAAPRPPEADSAGGGGTGSSSGSGTGTGRDERGGEGEPRLPAAVETALNDAIAGVHQVARYLMLKATKQP